MIKPLVGNAQYVFVSIHLKLDEILWDFLLVSQLNQMLHQYTLAAFLILSTLLETDWTATNSVDGLWVI